MKALFAALFIALFFFSASAQKSPVKFGDIPMEDMTMTSYPGDSSAEAVILVDYGEAYIMATSVSTKMTFERHVRIKVLQESGTSWANAIIPLFKAGSSEENIVSLKAATYNLENGKIVTSKMSKDAVFRERFNRNFIHEKFTLPDVRKGSVFEYTYKLTSDFLTNFPNWQFQSRIPTRLSEYWAIIPTFLSFEKYMQGYVTVTSYEVKPLNMSGYTANAHHYVCKNVPAFRPEPRMTSETDYIARINFALSRIDIPGQLSQDIMGSWPRLNSLLLKDEDFYGAVNGSGFLKDATEEVTRGMTDPLAKTTAIHNYVKESIEWDGVTDFYAGNLKKVIESRKGTSGDINLILGSMLRKAGLDVDMVLLSTRDHGFVRQQYPMARQFNYVVCLVHLPDKNVFLDATEKYLPINVLPERCLNGQGLVISDRNFGWIDLDTHTKSKTMVTGEFQLEENGKLEGTLSFVHDGYDAHRMRKIFSQKGEETYLKEFIGSKAWKVDESAFSNLEEVYKPAEESYTLEIPEHGMVAGDHIYFSPFIIDRLESNPYKSESRTYPVDYGSKVEKIYLCKIKAPEGYIVDEAPQSKIMMLPGNAARFMFNVVTSADGSWVTVTSQLQINRNIFTQKEYPNLREFYNQVVAKEAEQIVFKKKL